MQSENSASEAIVEPLFSCDEMSAQPPEPDTAATDPTDTVEEPQQRQLGIYELFRSPDSGSHPADESDATARILTHPRRSVWDL